MMVIFKKAFVLNGKKRSVGAITRLTPEKAEELKSKNIVAQYFGVVPPQRKTKTDFFKPKI